MERDGEREALRGAAFELTKIEGDEDEEDAVGVRKRLMSLACVCAVSTEYWTVEGKRQL